MTSNEQEKAMSDEERFLEYQRTSKAMMTHLLGEITIASEKVVQSLAESNRLPLTPKKLWNRFMRLFKGGKK